MSLSRLLRSALVTLVLASSLFTGCAATIDQKIGLTYTPLDKPLGRSNGEIAVSRIDAQQPAVNTRGEWIVGSLNNVHGVHQADILTDRQVGAWVTDALIQELRTIGYTTTYSAQLPAGALMGLVITDLNLFINTYTGTVTDEIKQELKFNVDVFKNGNRIKTLTVGARDKSKLLSANTEAIEKIMRQSLQDAMQQILPEVVTIFGK